MKNLEISAKVELNARLSFNNVDLKGASDAEIELAIRKALLPAVEQAYTSAVKVQLQNLVEMRELAARPVNLEAEMNKAFNDQFAGVLQTVHNLGFDL